MTQIEATNNFLEAGFRQGNPPSHPWDTHHQFSIKILLPNCYGVATMSRLLKIIGLFCKRAL